MRWERLTREHWRCIATEQGHSAKHGWDSYFIITCGRPGAVQSRWYVFPFSALFADFS